MTQKDKVKELVGRGLHSYHTKSLQQIDRIEKKNKEQNHKISILTNELDNDYLTKTEEGSVISLEHSKEGMVYLDELQGNTLVNYCTDGSKEMTLNGDIDLEGISVTTTEGVDNGKVDVMCEGNTLVNLVDKMWNNTQTYYTIDENYITILDSETDHRQGYYTLSGGQLNLIKPNTTYTIIAEITKNTLQRKFTLINNFQANGGDITSDDVSVPIGFVGRYIGKFTTLSDFTNRNRLGFSAGSGNRGEITLRNNFIILEGDWTNRDIPVSYFKGMKSVGQDDTNGHKIEILSSVGKENLLLNTDTYVDGENSSKTFTFSKDTSILKRNTITLSCDLEVENIQPIENGKCRIGMEMGVKFEDDTIAYYNIWQSSDFNGRKAKTISIPDKTIKNIMYIGIYVQCKATKHRVGRPKIEIGDIATSWCPSTLDNLNGLQSFINKKEISLNEPLRGLPNGVCDKFVKQGGKWYVERNCGEVVLDGTEVWHSKETFSGITRIRTNLPNDTKHTFGNSMCDNFITTHGDENYEHIRVSHSGILWYYTTNLEFTIEETVDLFKNKPTKVVYLLAVPIYEEITDVELITYLDTTHISNNSTIPCNMVVKNSGYSAIIKPSTLYTVAIDTNKSGTIGMNLGGVKGTTTNNVLTLTTPATLTDDSLRLHGKGIKGSKVRLLEGDKTNWIPSHFEGMKSSFEDKFDATDNTYKMEILSKDGNLIDIKHQALINKASGMSCDFITYKDLPCWQIRAQAYTEYYNYFRCKYEPNTQYSLSFDCEMIQYTHDGTQVGMTVIYTDGTIQKTGHMDKDTKRVEITTLPNKTVQCIKFQGWGYNGTINMYNMQLIKGNTPKTTMEKSNKIQFSSIEPLRSLPNGTKDKFIFRDGKLMIERNTKSILFNGSEDWKYRETRTDGHCYTLNISDLKKYGINSYTQGYVDRFFMRHLLPFGAWFEYLNGKDICLQLPLALGSANTNAIKNWLNVNNVKVVYEIEIPTYEEIPFELQKIILEGYENGTLFFDTNIPPTSTVTYAGETPIVKAVKLNKTEVLNNTNDINDNIVPYLMDMDYRVVCLQLQSENINDGVSMARLFGGVYEMLQRDIQSKRYSIDEYRHRLDAYLSANKITEDEYNKLGDMLNE